MVVETPRRVSSVVSEEVGEAIETRRVGSGSYTSNSDQKPKQKMSGIPRLQQQTPYKFKKTTSTLRGNLLQPSPPMDLGSNYRIATKPPMKGGPKKAEVTDMAIACHWKPRYEDEDGVTGAHISPKGDDEANGRAEIAIFAKIIPVPGSTLEIVHLNKNMFLQPGKGSFRAMPLLPDGTSPRMTPASMALKIDVVAGRCRRTADGKTKISRRKADENNTLTSLDGKDDAYDSDGAHSSASEDTVNSSIVPFLTRDMYGDGNYSSDTEEEDELKTGEQSQTVDPLQTWLDTYHSGANLTVNHDQVLSISFEENMRTDALVFEIYLLAEPIITPDGEPNSWTFILASLPFCKNGIQVSFNIVSDSPYAEHVFVTMPTLGKTHNIGKNVLSGTFFSNGNPKDNYGSTLVIRPHKILSMQEPTHYTTDITTKVGLVSYVQFGYITCAYMIKIVLNNMRPLENTSRARLTFHVYNVRKKDEWSLLACPGATTMWSEDDQCFILEVERPTSEIFHDIEFKIFANEETDTLEYVDLPKVVAQGGTPLGEIVVLEELGDQPLGYQFMQDSNIWREVENHPEKSHQWGTVYKMINLSPKSIHHFRLGLYARPFPRCGSPVVEHFGDGIVCSAKYIIRPGSQRLVGKRLCHVDIEIRYDVSYIGYNRKVCTFASERWTFLEAKYDGRPGDHGLIHPCDSKNKLWVALTDAEAAQQNHACEMHTLTLSWEKHTKYVGLSKEGVFVNTTTEGADQYEYMLLPHIYDKWVDIVDFVVEWPENDLAKSLETARWLEHSPNSGGYMRKLNHLRRATLKHEIYRNEKMYIIRDGVQLIALVPCPRRTKVEDLSAFSTPQAQVVTRDGYSFVLNTPSPSTPFKVSAHDDADGEESISPLSPLSPVSPFPPVSALSAMDDLTPRPLQQSRPKTPTKVSRTASNNSFDVLESFSPISTPVRDMISPGIRSPKPLTADPALKILNSSTAECDSSDVTLATPAEGPKGLEEAQKKKMAIPAAVELETFKSRSSSKKSRPSIERRVQGISMMRSLDDPSSAASKRIRKARVLAREKVKEQEKPKSVASNLFWAFWKMVQIAMMCIIITMIMTFCLGIYKNTMAAIQEIAQVKSEMQVFKVMFEGVYGVNFGDVKWQRVKLRKEGDLLVMVKGEALDDGDVVLKRVVGHESGGGNGAGADGSKEGFWEEVHERKGQEEDKGGKGDRNGNGNGNGNGNKVGNGNGNGNAEEKEKGLGGDENRKRIHDQGKGLPRFRKAEKKTKREDDDAKHDSIITTTTLDNHDEQKHHKLPQDGDNITVMEELAAEATQTVTSTSTSTMAVAMWGRDPARFSYPWMKVRETVEVAVEKAKEVVEESWAHFLVAWKAVWFMT